VAEKALSLLGPKTVVLTAMNGVPWWFFQEAAGAWGGMRLTSIDPEGRIAAAIPGRHIVGCVVHATCSVVEPGLVRHGFGNGLIIGESSGTVSARVEALAARLTAAGFDTTVTEHIQADIWYKLWGNMTMNPISALTGATCDRILDDPLLNRYTLAIMAEGAELEFTADGIAEVARVAFMANDRMENIGARRLHTVMSTLMDEVLFELPGWTETNIVFDAARVRERLTRVIGDDDLRRYIL